MVVAKKETVRFTFNFLFAVYNVILGISLDSFWFLTVGSYYAILSVMRVSVIAFFRKDRTNEYFMMRFSGAMILLLALVFGMIVVMTVGQEGATKHHEIVMITIALYAFTKLTLAIIGFVKARKETGVYHKTLCSITMTDGIVAIYSLQRSMLVSFEGMTSFEIMVMNTLSGVGMCLLIISIGINLMAVKK